MKFRFALLFFCLAVVVVGTTSASAADTVRVTAERADILADSNASARVLATASRGTVLEVIKREGAWLRVSTPGTGYGGYIPALFVESAYGAPTTIAPVTAPTQPAPPVQPPPVYATQPQPQPQPQPQAYPQRYSSGSQDVPVAELTAGYAYLYDDGFKDTGASGNFPIGWMVSVNFNLNKWLGVVGDVGGSYKSEALVVGVDENLSVLAFNGGFRFSIRNDAATPYFQAVFGGARYSDTAIGIGLAETHFAMQPGIGVGIKVSKLIGLDLGVDYRRDFGGTIFTNSNEFRAHAGVVFRVGQK